MKDRVAISSEQVMNQAMLRYEWNTIPWRKLEKNVFKLQKRIYQASLKGENKLVHKLQRLILKSHSAKLLAIRKVTQDNRGRKTAGIDGKTALTPEERIKLVSRLDISRKPQPTRRVWIPKPGKEEKRPLGIPTIADRALQTLGKMALEPEWEAKFEENSYGFRPGRNCHDAIEAIFSAIRMKNVYVLDADIAGCFDNINHNTLLEKLQTFPKFRKLIRKWLKAGVIDRKVFQSTESGTPQGGSISPLLANIALTGLETDTKDAMLPYLRTWWNKNKGYRRNPKELKQTLSIIRYADDFVVLHEDPEIINRSKEYIEYWLKEIGLELKESKTKISHTLGGKQAGFNFLGFNIRQYKVSVHNCGRSKSGFKTIIKPSTESVKSHIKKVKDTIRKYRGTNQSALISRLNPIIRGWSQYYCSVVARKTFEKASHQTHQKLWQWAKFKHPHKGLLWVKRKYFKGHGNDNWRFMDSEGYFLCRHNDFKIKRHIKVKGCKSPYDGDYVYWSKRMGKHPLIRDKVAMLIKSQDGKCAQCSHYFMPGDILEIHHVDKNHKNNQRKNLQLIHGHCHDRVHGKKRYV
ncbi:MAG: group II intron reverse transcriptase/maturase [Xenococcaceae cyanobacterium MO_207.B15]|nr:group II intron reverse transcriptase/maturase [Xenococcaceae cyanobacterium MO_207.B15]